MNSNANDNLYIVNDVPFQPELPKLLRRLRVKAGSPYQADVERVLAEAQAIARPKALYKVAQTPCPVGVVAVAGDLRIMGWIPGMALKDIKVGSLFDVEAKTLKNGQLTIILSPV